MVKEKRESMVQHQMNLLLAEQRGSLVPQEMPIQLELVEEFGSLHSIETMH